jgi:hypothetical protein
MHREGRFRVWRPKPKCECAHVQELHLVGGPCNVSWCVCRRFKLKRWPSKEHPKGHNYGGRKFDSGLEALKAADLDQMKRCGEIVDWTSHKEMPLLVNGHKIRSYIVDFVVEHPGGRTEYIETKGVWTREAQMKRDHFIAQYVRGNPNVSYRVVRCS